MVNNYNQDHKTKGCFVRVQQLALTNKQFCIVNQSTIP
jgi:hypothetical protein